LKSSVLFLDLDGVISTDFKSFNPDCVIALKKILDETNAIIVISSCWRKGFIDWSIEPHRLVESKDVLKVLGRWFEDCGLPSQRLIDVTPIDISGYRGTEISQWLAAHSRVQNFIILDDDSDMEPHRDRLIQTDGSKGLTLENADEAIKLLNKIS